ncbi:hypothetical protein GQ43DRAFT_430120 [Delitschia confertaspora ATCC 74209]|uniref:Uncharacterized protein n=1 Tax=Delitschia confertaspora ATCC 74209 TaxID=1513339 RepID=A0A9P4MRM5_9PLEO|nr:hypothetical protein GQ43DRAFT_430120 [Delitschia confertaspora ATCC 74209]
MPPNASKRSRESITITDNPSTSAQNSVSTAEKRTRSPATVHNPGSNAHLVKEEVEAPQAQGKVQYDEGQGQQDHGTEQNITVFFQITAKYNGKQLENPTILRKNMSTVTYEGLSDILNSKEAKCRKIATDKRLNCFIVSLDAQVEVFLQPDKRGKRVATFHLVDADGLDKNMIQQLARFVQGYAGNKNVTCLEILLYPTYSSVPRRPDISNDHHIATQLIKDFDRSFSCKDRSCANHGKFCVRFQNEHLPVSMSDRAQCVLPSSRGDKTVVTTILGQIIRGCEDKAAREPWKYEKDNLAKAISQTPFLIECLPITDADRKAKLAALNKKS